MAFNGIFPDLKIQRDINVDAITTESSSQIPVYTILPPARSSQQGCLALLSTSQLSGLLYYNNGQSWVSVGGGVSGDVFGPPSSTTDSIAVYSNTTGKLLRNSSVAIDNAGGVSATGLKLSSVSVGTSLDVLIIDGTGEIQKKTIVPAGTISIGAIDSGVSTGNALVLTGSSLSIDSATPLRSGVVTTGNQDFAGIKTFAGIKIPSLTSGAFNEFVVIDTSTGQLYYKTVTISGTNTGDVTLSTPVATSNANGALLTGQLLQLQYANATSPGIMSTITQTLGGNKTFNGIVNLQNVTANSDLTPRFLVRNATGNVEYKDILLSGLTPVTIGAVGAPSTNGAVISPTQVLTLTVADGVNPGIVSATTQTLGGNKTLTGVTTFNAVVKLGSVSPNIDTTAAFLIRKATGDIESRSILISDITPVTISTPLAAAANANGALISASQVLQFYYAGISGPGIVSTSTQSFAGNKTLTGITTFSGTVKLGSVVTNSEVTKQFLVKNTGTTNIETYSMPQTILSIGNVTDPAPSSTTGMSISMVGLLPTISLYAASSLTPGIVTTTTQTLAGNKTLSGALTLNSSLTLSATPLASIGPIVNILVRNASLGGIIEQHSIPLGAISGVSIGSLYVGSDANAAKISATQVLQLQTASATGPGVLSTDIGSTQQLGNGRKTVSTYGLSFTNTSVPSYTPAFLDYYESTVVNATVAIFASSVKAGTTTIPFVFPTDMSVRGVVQVPPTAGTLNQLPITLIRIGKVVNCVIPAFWLKYNALSPWPGSTGVRIAQYGIIPDRFKPVGDVRKYCNAIKSGKLGSTNPPGFIDPSPADLSYPDYYNPNNWTSSGQDQSNIIIRAPDAATRWPKIEPGIPPLGGAIQWPDIWMLMVMPSSLQATVGTGLYEDEHLTWVTA